MTGGRSNRRGLTLIETLLAISLLSLLASVTLVGLSGTTDAANVRAGVGAALRADAAARRSGNGGRPVSIHFDERSAELVLKRLAQNENAHHRFALDPTTSVRWSDANEDPISELRFGLRRGTEDYVLSVHSGDASQSWRVSGLTGWAERIRDETP